LTVVSETDVGATALPRDRPGARGVDAARISDFLDSVADNRLELHGLMIYRAGAVVAEGFWNPYASRYPHMLHSAVKSWTGTAVGLAIGDGLLRLDDKVIDFFPEHLPSVVSDNLAAMTVKDLLTMRSGHNTGSSGGEWRALRESWVSLFLREDLTERPGQEFIYSSGSSYMLSAIVTKVTGKTVHALLDERLFRPLGCGSVTWDISPEGYSTGGNGLSCTLEDMLKFGVLYLHDGMWNGKRLLPVGWVAEATRNHVRDIWMGPLDGRRFLARNASPGAALQKRDDYGFQWWITPHGGYRANGLFGQYLIVLPERDAVIAINAAVPYGETGLADAVWRHLLPALDGPPSDQATESRLADQLGRLELPMPVGGPRSGIEATVNGRTFQMEPNEDGVKEIRFDFSADCCRFTLTDGRGTHAVTVGLAGAVESDTTMTGARLHHTYEPDSLHVVATGTWLDQASFNMVWRFVETAFCDTVLCRFDGGRLRLDRRVNVNPGGTERPTITGQLV
jgi:CubicO group peptidase (beta-lactamase class C family)